MQNNSTDAHDSFSVCAQQLKHLLPGATELVFLEPDGTVLWTCGESTYGDLLQRLLRAPAPVTPQPRVVDAQRLVALFPMHGRDAHAGALLAPFKPYPGESLERAVDRTWRRIKPTLDHLGRRLAHDKERSSGALHLFERVEESEWLLGLSAELRSMHDATSVMQRLLAAAVERMNASYGALTIADEHLNLTYASRSIADSGTRRAYRQAHAYIISYMRRRGAPLLASRPPATDSAGPSWKIMAVPIIGRNPEHIGAMAFCRSTTALEFSHGDLELARRVAGLIQRLPDVPRDRATGVPTRVAPELQGTDLILTPTDSRRVVRPAAYSL